MQNLMTIFFKIAKKAFLLSLFCASMSEANFMIGQTVEFGHYSISKSYSREPITFIVLDETQDKVLLLSEKVIDAMPYNTKNEPVTWENSTLRRWLNKEFLESAFSSDEISSILLSRLDTPDNPSYGTKGGYATDDFVFLLSEDEADRYFLMPEDRTASISPLMKEKVYAHDSGDADWWLRTPGGRPNRASYVRIFGKIQEGGSVVNDDTISVRPAIWVRKSYFEERKPEGMSASR